MRHWTQLGEASIPGSDKSIFLIRGKDDFFIKLSGGLELMNTRKHGSEDALAALPCKKLRHPDSARVLVGGLGMGFTLAAALGAVGPSAQVTVAELIPEVVEWNRGPLGDRSGRPLDDPRTQVHVGDVADLLREKHDCYDVIALDVDNGPEGLTKSNNSWIYSEQGIVATVKALKPAGIVSYWSVSADQGFNDRLKRCGLKVEEVTVYAHGTKGARHTIWLGVRVS
jgi:spermidine synthase